MLLGQSPTPRRRLKRSDLIAEDLKRWMSATAMGPGDRLPQERELIRLFGCARATIREALTSLEVQGLVDVVPGPQGGARLSAVAETRAILLLNNFFYFEDLQARDLYELRAVLEPLIVRNVAGHLTEADFARLEATVAVSEDGLDGKVRARTLREAELEFHAILADRVPNRMLRFFARFVLETLRRFVMPKAVAQGQLESFGRHCLAAHRAILTALRAADGEAAARCMAEHIGCAAAFVDEVEAAFDRVRLLGDSEAA